MFTSNYTKGLNGNALIIAEMLLSGEPATFDALFGAVNKTPGIYDARMMQQRLGGSVSIANKHLWAFGIRIVAGEPRGTYRMRHVL